MSNNSEILAMLEEILARLDDIEQKINQPRAANINRIKPRLRVITDDEE